MRSLLLFISLFLTLYFTCIFAKQAIRVARFQVDYPTADFVQINKHNRWSSIMKKSVLASLRFINKHWLICGEDEKSSDSSTPDCGKLQVTGEVVRETQYRINATFIAQRDPIKNTKVDATSTLQGVLQIGLRGGIFQYTNALKILGKPAQTLNFEEAFFCYPGFELTNQDECVLATANGGKKKRKYFQ